MSMKSREIDPGISDRPAAPCKVLLADKDLGKRMLVSALTLPLFSHKLGSPLWW